MVRNLGGNKVMWLVVSGLALVAAVIRVANQGVYSKVVTTDVLPGVISQDLVTILASLLVMLLTVRMKEGDVTKQVIVLGILAYFFYGYGIYVIEQIYTALYFVYMAVFGLSFYAIVYAMASLHRELDERVEVPNPVRYVSVAFLLMIPLVFYPLWTSQILPLMHSGEKLEFLYSIYILDLCFIMPAFLIAAFMTAKDHGLGLLITPALFVHGFTLLFPVALGGMLKPLYQQASSPGEVGFFLVLSVMFLALGIVYLRYMRTRVHPVSS